MKALLTHVPTGHPPGASLPWSRHPLTRKLVIVTVIKVIGLFLLWWAFFSGNGHGDITPDQAAKALLHPQSSKTQTGGANAQRDKDLTIRRGKEEGR